ncbi:radical SAM protein [Streptosporangium sp. NPDC051022]|uniref:radical SAM protein n=1 Tax=Streptosporangium sp. NPDC051022 TaxID=3155752 RepID=UPI00343F2F60
MDILALRPVPAAAVLMAITRRCPLRCRHCSTDSLPTGPEHPGEVFLRFAGTFTPHDRPDLVMLTGGEPLLRPRLVRALAETAARNGSRTMILSGMFFAPRIPPAIEEAIEAADHFSASLDAFHEEEVPRENVFAVMRTLLARGKDLSFHITGTGPDDPYLRDVTAAVRREFGDRVPMLVSRVQPVGRALAMTPATPTAAPPGAETRALPCAMAAWPVVGFDGTITACCNQDVIDHRPIPAHLRLGHAGHDGWDVIRERCLGSGALRAIRTYGPLRLAGATGRGAGKGYCETCRELDAPSLPPSPVSVFLERQVRDMQLAGGGTGFARRYGCPPYSELVSLGHPRRNDGL